MKVTKLDFEIDGVDSKPIRGNLRFIEAAQSKGVVFITHGFKGFKDWGFHPYLGERLAQMGYLAVHFNFSHNGVGENLMEFTELDLFKENRFSYEIEELDRVVEWVIGGQLAGLPDFAEERRIFLMGHSRGGVSITGVASRRRDISGVISLAAISNVPCPSEDITRKWRQDGVWYVENLRTKQKMPLGVGLLEEMLDNPDMIEKAVRDISVPFLIIHGDEDTSVPVESASKLASWAKLPELVIVKGADHVFDVTHPFVGTTVSLERVLESISDFVD